MKTVLAVVCAASVLSACATTSSHSPRVVERLPSNEVVVPQPPPPPPLPPLAQADLVRLAKQGLAAESIIGRIKESRTRLRLSASEILALKTQGVPLAVLDHLLDSDRLATADDCTMQINKIHEDARQGLQQAVQQAEMMGWQRCQLSYPGPFPMFRPFPYRR